MLLSALNKYIGYNPLLKVSEKYLAEVSELFKQGYSRYAITKGLIEKYNDKNIVFQTLYNRLELLEKN
ncbi:MULTISPECIES: hypothetical protein [unclassified Campylobacter]|uniref:hypothetical protein n=1 Tax=unclassified Campylobacter TaxID=2593542 RepID=UPI001237CC01|nr:MULTISPECIES: hypothetical protein [unclassified Campylobacter]KAA6226379.1 hypothetical protein FMM57_06240 [Campylobacter sp. LR286c]KAA6226583.1 hypothetical protein FMM54_03995 [Campylobacter sp. LR185c]KAA6230308.1 hypothetical protein FMM58_06440 [Campylobacter sp. LR291e]KAA8603611.1 hypothetical protein CGP82_06365 [Campylobacter sp. LR185c]